MFAFPDFLISPEEKKRRAEHHKAEVARRLTLAVPWTPDIRWQEQLTIQASTYPVRRLFEVQPCGPDVGATSDSQRACSPTGAFVYCEKRVPRGVCLETIYSNRRGTILFDGEVLIPALHERMRDSTRYEPNPWMSLTPMEMFTLRGGTKRAKGRVVVAGLGLGHQLIEVSHRRQVREIVLVERSVELIDWLMPRIRPHLGNAPVEIVAGDAYKIMPMLEADVALVDIFPGYGGNSYERDQLRRNCPKIGFIWAWGSTSVS